MGTSNNNLSAIPKVAVFGATGHTGKFVVAELARRGIKTVAIGRDGAKLSQLCDGYSELEIRVASVDDERSLDRTLAGTTLVVNCAGPFLDTAAPLIEAALRQRIHYIDVSAEQKVALTIFENYSRAARDARVLIVPSMGFFGGLGDLLATAAIADWEAVDEVLLAVALDSWNPTRGTRLTGERNPGRRSVFSSGTLRPIPDTPPTRSWKFSRPFGMQEVVAFPLTETVVVSRHLRTPEIHAYLNTIALNDIHDPNTPPPTVVNESGHSEQRFQMDVAVRRGTDTRSASVSGFDIYAITAPLVAEAVVRIIGGDVLIGEGALAPGEIFNAQHFLESLSPKHLSYSKR